VYGSHPAYALDWVNANDNHSHDLSHWTRCWQVETRHGKDKEWQPLYRFVASAEMLVDDFRAGILDMAMRTEGLHTENVIVLKYITERRGGDGREELGWLRLHQNTVKKCIGDVSEVLGVLETEEERAIALKKYFGIEITAEEIANIRGRKSALPSKQNAGLARL